VVGGIGRTGRLGSVGVPAGRQAAKVGPPRPAPAEVGRRISRESRFFLYGQRKSGKLGICVAAQVGGGLKVTVW
jgi:hypothetical protein